VISGEAENAALRATVEALTARIGELEARLRGRLVDVVAAAVLGWLAKSRRPLG